MYISDVLDWALFSDEPLWRGSKSTRELRVLTADPLAPSLQHERSAGPVGDEELLKWVGEVKHRHLVNVCGVCILAVAWWSLMGCTEGVVEAGFRPGGTFPIDDDVHSLASRDQALTTVFYLPALLVAMGMRMRGVRGRILDGVTSRMVSFVLTSCYLLWLWPDPSSLAGVAPTSNHCWLLVALVVFRASSVLLQHEGASRVRRLLVLPLAACTYLCLCLVGSALFGMEFHAYQVVALVFLGVGLQLPTGLLGKRWPIAVQVFVSLGLLVMLQMFLKAPSFIQAYIGQSLMVVGTADQTVLPVGVQIGAFIRELTYGCGAFLALLFAIPSHYVPVVSELGLDPLLSWCLIPLTVNVGRSAWRVYFLPFVRPRCTNLTYEFLSYALTVISMGILVALPPTQYLFETVAALVWNLVRSPVACILACFKCLRRPC